MHEIVKNEAGEVIRFRSKRLGATAARQQYSGGSGAPQWSKRFYFAKMINGEFARFPLSADPKVAECEVDQLAAFLLDPKNTLLDAKRRFNPRALARPGNFSTVGELFEFHEEHRTVLDLSPKSALNYRRCLLLLLRQVDAFRRGDEFEAWSGQRSGAAEREAPWRALSLAEVNERLATDYQRLMVPGDIEDEEEELTQKISCDTNLRNARALFSKEAMKLYVRSSLSLPDMEPFLAVGLFNAKKYFVLQPVPVIRSIFAAAPILRAADLNAYRAFLLCLQCGLRKTEAANLRMVWLQEEEDTPAVLIHEDGKFKPKHGHGRKVLLDAWVAAEMRELASTDGDYFLDGPMTERTDSVFVRLNAWLRKLGVDSKKPTHELRKLWFSQKVKRESVLAAAQQGGHRDVKITQSFYASSMMPDNVLPFWQEPTLAALAKVRAG